MRQRLNLEALESRLTPSGAPLVVTGPMYLDHSATVPALTVTATGDLTLGNGVHLTVAGGTSDIAGQIHYQGYYTSLQFQGGSVDVHGTLTNDFTQAHSVGEVYFNGGVHTQIHDALFQGMAAVNGVTPQWAGFGMDQTSEMTFTGAANFTGGGYVDNDANLLFANAGTAVNAQEVILDTGHSEVTVPQAEVNATLIASPRQQLEILPGASLDVGNPDFMPWTGSTLANVYVASGQSVQVDPGASLVANNISYGGMTYGGGQVLVSTNGLDGGFYIDPIALQKLEDQAFPS